eukprot:5299991-Pyramimonas_sp.AAC.1
MVDGRHLYLDAVLENGESECTDWPVAAHVLQTAWLPAQAASVQGTRALLGHQVRFRNAFPEDVQIVRPYGVRDIRAVFQAYAKPSTFPRLYKWA